MTVKPPLYHTVNNVKLQVLKTSASSSRSFCTTDQFHNPINQSINPPIYTFPSKGHCFLIGDDQVN